MDSPNLPNTPYQRMCDHHRIHQFKRGANKGDAPLDVYQRYGHKRIRIYPTHADVILYQTAIFRAFPDGTVTLATDRWRSNTTKDTLNRALALFCRWATPSYHAYIFSGRKFGLSQWQYQCHDSYVFYDGMILGPDGIPLEPRPFKRRVIDRSLSKPFTAASRPFKQTFPLLHAALPDTTSANTPRTRAFYDNQLHNPGKLHSAITSTPELWPTIVEYYSYSRYSSHKLAPDVVLRAVMQAAKESMYITVDAV